MRRFDLIVTCVCCVLLGYFAWHGLKGPRGYPYHDRLAAEVGNLAAKQEAVEAARVKLEERVVLLRPESIDPDMLDEMVRAQLQMAAPGDLVVYTRR